MCVVCDVATKEEIKRDCGGRGAATKMPPSQPPNIHRHNTHGYMYDVS